jgi:hypothetical protein
MGTDLGDMVLMLLGGATVLPSLYGVMEGVRKRLLNAPR